MIDVQDKDAEGVIAAAQGLWARFYRKPRASGSERRERRRDLGVPRVVGDDLPGFTNAKPSLAGWLRQRHSSISSAASRSEVPQMSLDESVWTQGHDKELKFAQDHEITDKLVVMDFGC